MNLANALLGGAVILHVAVSVIHGIVHLAIPVRVAGWQYGYAVVVILSVPIIGAVLVHRGRTTAGSLVLFLAGLAALAFEGLYHFVLTNPDHVTAVERGRALFAFSAILTTVGDAILVAVSAWFLKLYTDSRRCSSTAETNPD